MAKARRKKTALKQQELESGFLLTIGDKGVDEEELGAFREAVQRALVFVEQGFLVAIKVFCFHVDDPYDSIARPGSRVTRQLSGLTPNTIRLEFVKP